MAINIEDIMSEIRSDIQEKGLNSSMLSFADVPCDANPENPTDAYDPDTLRSNVQYVSTQYQMQPYRPLTGNPAADAVLYRTAGTGTDLFQRQYCTGIAGDGIVYH